MSYDLYFTGERIPKAEFDSYFRGRKRYELNESQAWYSNDDSGVYFSFEYSDDDSGEDLEWESFAAFNQNYYRPHFFALEAERELTAFVANFGCTVADPQNGGMGEGAYTSEGFLQGWNHGNKCGYSAILSSEDAPEEVLCRPTAELEAIWRWNYTREQISESLGMDIFVPRIMFMMIAGLLKSVCVWPDAISILMPKTDMVYSPRSELAPKRFLRKKEDDYCIIDQSTLDGVLSDFDSTFPLPARHPHSETLPIGVREFVQNRPPHEGEVSGVALDGVLNAEYVTEFQNGNNKRMESND